MKRKQLGRSGIEIPPLMFGGNVFGWTVDEATSFVLLDALADRGLTAIDTADVYSNWVPGHAGGESETIIGRWMKDRGLRDRMVICTKVGMRMGEGEEGLSASWIERAVDRSLRRLQTDYIDLYQAHEDDEDTPLEETLFAFGKLIKKGKIRAIGASNHSAARIEQACAVSERFGLPRYESLQPLYNLIERQEFESRLGPVCEKLGIGVISYFSLAAGFLTGKYRSGEDLAKSRRGHRVQHYLNEKNLRVIDVLHDIAGPRNASCAQIALAWLMARPCVTAPIASATTIAQVEDLAAAVALTLSPEEIARLDDLSKPS